MIFLLIFLFIRTMSYEVLISDWNSYLFSSDLARAAAPAQLVPAVELPLRPHRARNPALRSRRLRPRDLRGPAGGRWPVRADQRRRSGGRQSLHVLPADRKSVV